VNLAGGGASALSALYGLIYDDRENAKSYTIAGRKLSDCRVMMNGTRPCERCRVFEALIPAGRTGWMRISSINDEGHSLDAMINYNPNERVQSGTSFSTR
jgi:hypothetical protein